MLRVFQTSQFRRRPSFRVCRLARKGMASDEASRVTADLLHDRQYHIEFNAFLTNHVKHAVVALHGLESPADVIQTYWEKYTTMGPFKLEAARTAGQKVTEATWEDQLGKKKDFSALFNFFDEQEREKGLEGVVQAYAPLLLPGATAALMHGIIHLGWGLDAGSRCMIIEGLAYMAYTFVPVHPERFKHQAHDEAGPLESFVRVSRSFEVDHVANAVKAILEDPRYTLSTGFQQQIKEAELQRNIAKVLHEGLPLFLELPTWLDTMPVATILEEMHKAVAVVYLVSAGEPEARRSGNFVVLHLITGLWGAEQVASILPEPQQRDAYKIFWAACIALLCGSPDGLPKAAALEETWAKYGAPVDGAAAIAMADVPDWDVIVKRAQEEVEEHNIKLVYVARELWQRYGEWPGFQVVAATFTECLEIPDLSG